MNTRRARRRFFILGKLSDAGKLFAASKAGARRFFIHGNGGRVWGVASGSTKADANAVKLSATATGTAAASGTPSAARPSSPFPSGAGAVCGSSPPSLHNTAQPPGPRTQGNSSVAAEARRLQRQQSKV